MTFPQATLQNPPGGAPPLPYKLPGHGAAGKSGPPSSGPAGGGRSMAQPLGGTESGPALEQLLLQNC